MRKFALFLVLIFGVSCPAFAQSKDKWRAGSALSLAASKTYVLTIFISETEWKYAEKRKLYDSIYEAQDWIKAQAALYNKRLTFEGGNYGLQKTIILDTIASGTGSGTEPVDWISKVLKKVGYKNSLEFYAWAKKTTKSDNVLVLIVANKKGRGYAMEYSKDMEKVLYFVEGCILYSQYEDGQKLYTASIAHEFLHLFGAWDLYKTFEQSQENADKAKSLYPNDIMLRIAFNIDDLHIGKLSAWRIGFSSKEESEFDSLRPSLHPKK